MPSCASTTSMRSVDPSGLRSSRQRCSDGLRVRIGAGDVVDQSLGWPLRSSRCLCQSSLFQCSARPRALLQRPLVSRTVAFFRLPRSCRAARQRSRRRTEALQPRDRRCALSFRCRLSLSNADRRGGRRIASAARRDRDRSSRPQLDARRLRQSILKWAFEGKLVDQDPDRRARLGLLERIRPSAQSAEATAKTTPPGRRRKETA